LNRTTTCTTIVLTRPPFAYFTVTCTPTTKSWPFVTVPDFAIRAAKVLSLSDLLTVATTPVVTNETRLEWEQYSVANDKWSNSAVAMQATYDLYHGPLGFANGTNPIIHGDFGNIPYNTS